MVTHNTEMNLDAVPSHEAVSTPFVRPGSEAEVSIVFKGKIDVSDWEGRRDALEDSHTRGVYPWDA